jgi:putative transposase
LLKKEIRYDVQNHIISNCKDKQIFLQEINGFTEHLHCLLSLGRTRTIANVLQLIKGESSNWINKNKFMPEHFSWQDDYYAVSVSELQVKRVIQYIRNQELHHAKKTFEQEVDEFMERYGWVKSNSSDG